MKNLSIRARILAGIVLVNLIGMVVVMIYLHQSYSGGLDVTAQKSVTQGVAAWSELTMLGADEFGSPSDPAAAAKYVESMKNITGAEYGVMVDKAVLNEAEYASNREKANLPNNWNERDTYVLIAATDDAAADNMQLSAAPDTIPEIGKLVGVENGACSKTCHGAVTGSGDFWTVKWSTDSKSRAHTVFPVADKNGRPIGVVYSLEDISAQADAARQSLVRTTAVIVTGLLISTLLIGWLLDALVFRRLQRMITSIEDLSVRVAGGDFDAHFTPDGTTDEIGRFEEFFARFMDLVSNTLKSMMK